MWGRVGGGIREGSAQSGLGAWGCLKRPRLPVVTEVNSDKNYKIGPSGFWGDGGGGVGHWGRDGGGGPAGSLFWTPVDGF